MRARKGSYRTHIIGHDTVQRYITRTDLLPDEIMMAQFTKLDHLALENSDKFFLFFDYIAHVIGCYWLWPVVVFLW